MIQILDLGTRITPFGDPVGSLPLFGDSLEQFQRQAATIAGVEDRLTIADRAFVTAPVLSAFAAKAHSASEVVRLAIPAANPAAAYVSPLSSVERSGDRFVFDVFLNAKKDADLERLRAEATPVVVDVATKTYRRQLPRLGPAPHFIDIPADGIVAAHVTHWVHVLWLYPLLLPWAVESERMEPFRCERAQADSFVGERVKIHPTAYLEGAVIDDDVEIGAFCSIRHSYVGKGSRLADHTSLARSVLGAGTRTLADARFSHFVSLGRSTLASFFIKDSILGSDVFLTSGVIFWSEPVEGTVLVEQDGEWIDTGRKSLGGCAGHGSVLGARTIVAPGRALPCRTTVVMRREEGVERVRETDPGVPMCWDSATLVPYEELRPGATPEELI